MNRSLKIAVIAVVIAVALIGIAITAAEPVLNSSQIRSQIENIVGETLDMSFKIEGRIELGFWPFLSVVANKPEVSTSQGKIASADRIEIDPSLLDLIYLKVHLDEVQIYSPQLTFDPHAIDKILALADGGPAEPLPVKSLVIDSFSISKAKFFYSDTQTVVDMNEMNFEGGRLAVIGDRKVLFDDVVSFFQAIEFKGEVAAREIRSQDFKVTNLKSLVKNEKNILTFDPIELQYLQSVAKLRATLDLSNKSHLLESQISISGLKLETLAQTVRLSPKLAGNVSATANISAGPIDIGRIFESASGKDQKGSTASNGSYPVKSFNVEDFEVAATDVAFADGSTTIDIPRLNLSGNRLSVIEKNQLLIKDFDTLWRSARFDADVHIRSLSVGSEKFRDIKSAINGDRGSFKSDSIELDYFGGRTKIAGFFNTQDNLNYLRARIEIAGFDLAKSYQESWEADFAKGEINIIAEFEARAALIRDMFKNVNGFFSIQGQDLVLKGVDLDKALDEFKKISRYGFNDFSALLLLGPLGTVVSHGYDQLEALEKMMAATGDSTIHRVVSDWNVVAGVVTAKDVAFSTQRNRVAVKGSLDLPNQKFNNVTIAVVDPDGCIVNAETVDGPFENPEVKDVGVVERIIVRPLKKFFQTKCIFFYDGAVPHPIR